MRLPWPPPYIRKRWRYKPGMYVWISGQYVDSDGNQRTCVKGSVFPPTVRPGLTWKLSDESRGNR